jgi:hypothetical protein
MKRWNGGLPDGCKTKEFKPLEKPAETFQPLELFFQPDAAEHVLHVSA